MENGLNEPLLEQGRLEGEKVLTDGKRKQNKAVCHPALIPISL